MAKYLGHNTPLGAFRNLGSWLQRRALGTSSLSILDLKTFYPQGFPAFSTTENSDDPPQPNASVENSNNEPQSSTSDHTTVARKLDSSTPSANFKPLTTQPTETASPSFPSSSSSPPPFRASLQRYFTPDTQRPKSTKESPQQDSAHLASLNHQSTDHPDSTDYPDLTSATISNLQPTVSTPSTETTALPPEIRSSDIIKPSLSPEDTVLQRSIVEQPTSNTSQPSVANSDNSIQNLQTSKEKSPTPVNHDAIQSSADLTNSQSAGPAAAASNTSAQQLPPGLDSTDIKRSIQSLRESVSSVQRASELTQHISKETQPGETPQPASSSEISQPIEKHSELGFQAVSQKTEAHPSQPQKTPFETSDTSSYQGYNLSEISTSEPRTILQPQSDTETDAIAMRAENGFTPQPPAIVQRAIQQNDLTSEQVSSSENNQSASKQNSPQSIGPKPLVSDDSQLVKESDQKLLPLNTSSSAELQRQPHLSSGDPDAAKNDGPTNSQNGPQSILPSSSVPLNSEVSKNIQPKSEADLTSTDITRVYSAEIRRHTSSGGLTDSHNSPLSHSQLEDVQSHNTNLNSDNNSELDIASLHKAQPELTQSAQQPTDRSKQGITEQSSSQKQISTEPPSSVLETSRVTQEIFHTAVQRSQDLNPVSPIAQTQLSSAQEELFNAPSKTTGSTEKPGDIELKSQVMAELLQRNADKSQRSQTSNTANPPIQNPQGPSSVTETVGQTVTESSQRSSSEPGVSDTSPSIQRSSEQESTSSAQLPEANHFESPQITDAGNVQPTSNQLTPSARQLTVSADNQTASTTPQLSSPINRALDNVETIHRQPHDDFENSTDNQGATSLHSRTESVQPTLNSESNGSDNTKGASVQRSTASGESGEPFETIGNNDSLVQSSPNLSANVSVEEISSETTWPASETEHKNHASQPASNPGESLQRTTEKTQLADFSNTTFEQSKSTQYPSNQLPADIKTVENDSSKKQILSQSSPIQRLPNTPGEEPPIPEALDHPVLEGSGSPIQRAITSVNPPAAEIYEEHSLTADSNKINPLQRQIDLSRSAEVHKSQPAPDSHELSTQEVVPQPSSQEFTPTKTIPEIAPTSNPPQPQAVFETLNQTGNTQSSTPETSDQLSDVHFASTASSANEGLTIQLKTEASNPSPTSTASANAQSISTHHVDLYPHQSTLENVQHDNPLEPEQPAPENSQRATDVSHHQSPELTSAPNILAEQAGKIDTHSNEELTIQPKTEASNPLPTSTASANAQSISTHPVDLQPNQSTLENVQQGNPSEQEQPAPENNQRANHRATELTGASDTPEKQTGEIDAHLNEELTIQPKTEASNPSSTSTASANAQSISTHHVDLHPHQSTLENVQQNNSLEPDQPAPENSQPTALTSAPNTLAKQTGETDNRISARNVSETNQTQSSTSVPAKVQRKVAQPDQADRSKPSHHLIEQPVSPIGQHSEANAALISEPTIQRLPDITIEQPAPPSELDTNVATESTTTRPPGDTAHALPTSGTDALLDDSKTLQQTIDAQIQRLPSEHKVSLDSDPTAQRSSGTGSKHTPYIDQPSEHNNEHFPDTATSNNNPIVQPLSDNSSEHISLEDYPLESDNKHLSDTVSNIQRSLSDNNLSTTFHPENASDTSVSPSVTHQTQLGPFQDKLSTVSTETTSESDQVIQRLANNDITATQIDPKGPITDRETIVRKESLQPSATQIPSHEGVGSNAAQDRQIHKSTEQHISPKQIPKSFLHSNDQIHRSLNDTPNNINLTEPTSSASIDSTEISQQRQQQQDSGSEKTTVPKGPSSERSRLQSVSSEVKQHTQPASPNPSGDAMPVAPMIQPEPQSGLPSASQQLVTETNSPSIQQKADSSQSLTDNDSFSIRQKTEPITHSNETQSFSDAELTAAEPLSSVDLADTIQRSSVDNGQFLSAAQPGLEDTQPLTNTAKANELAQLTNKLTKPNETLQRQVNSAPTKDNQSSKTEYPPNNYLSRQQSSTAKAASQSVQTQTRLENLRSVPDTPLSQPLPEGISEHKRASDTVPQTQTLNSGGFNSLQRLPEDASDSARASDTAPQALSPEGVDSPQRLPEDISDHEANSDTVPKTLSPEGVDSLQRLPEDVSGNESTSHTVPQALSPEGVDSLQRLPEDISDHESISDTVSKTLNPEGFDSLQRLPEDISGNESTSHTVPQALSPEGVDSLQRLPEDVSDNERANHTVVPKTFNPEGVDSLQRLPGDISDHKTNSHPNPQSPHIKGFESYLPDSTEILSERLVEPHSSNIQGLENPMVPSQGNKTTFIKRKPFNQASLLKTAPDEDNSPKIPDSLGTFVLRKALGSFSHRQLPKVLKPLGVLKPLPSLQSDQSQIARQIEQEHSSPLSASSKSIPPVTSEAKTQQPNGVQGQDIPDAWSDIESLVTGLTGNSQSTPSTDDNTTAVNANASTNNNTAKVQRKSASGAQDANSIPNEWSNLEDLVTHLHSSNHGSTNSSTSKQSTDNQSSRNQFASKASPQSPQTIKSTQPATVQRTSAESTFIQRCADDLAPDASSDAEDESETNHNYSQYLELLVQEVYSLLRQRLSLERERRGPQYPR